jgi:uncharacterized protein (TIGR02145 family)
MKKIMKQHSKRLPLWGFKGILSVALSSLGIIAFAQGADVCQGTGYTIADAVPASTGSEYRWVENDLILEGTNNATYDVPNNKATGVYTYVRQSKSAECPDWQSSNEFTVTVFACSFTAGTTTGATATFTDSRDGRQYKTVVMPDGRTWFAQNLNYTKDLVFNMYAAQANGKSFIDRETTAANSAVAIGSYWCPGVSGSTYSGDQNACNIYGALYTWETAMMVDGKYADETRTSSAWDESWVSSNYFSIGAPGTTPSADMNCARGGTNMKGGGRGICPQGWYIPTLRDWAKLLDAVENPESGNPYTTSTPTEGFIGVSACARLKSELHTNGQDIGDGSWVDPIATDAYGFSWEPAGIATTLYGSRGYCVYGVTSTVLATQTPIYRCDNKNSYMALIYRPRTRSMTIRCIKGL